MKRLLISNIVQPSVEGNAGFFAGKAVAGDFEGLMDPVIAINHFESTGEEFVGTHANTGFSELSYIFEDSVPYQTIDAQGNPAEVTPGSLLWVMAGKGREYTEAPVRQGERVEGIQLFLNIPAGSKNTEAVTLPVSSSEIPLIEDEGVRVRILCGSTGTRSSEVKTLQPLTLLHIFLQPGKEFVQVLPANWSGTAFVIGGRFDLMTSEETYELDEGMVISMAYSEYNEPIRFTALTATELLFVSGEPVAKEAKSLRKIQGREAHLIPAGTPDTLKNEPL